MQTGCKKAFEHRRWEDSPLKVLVVIMWLLQVKKWLSFVRYRLYDVSIINWAIGYLVQVAALQVDFIL